MFWWFLLAFFLVLFFVPILVLVLLPLGLTAHSIVVLLTAIPQLLAVARDRQRRRHHALEHATINVLEERAGTPIDLGERFEVIDQRRYGETVIVFARAAG